MSSPGLRERKKAKTRRSIQEHALRLIAEQGYDATTVEQIAEAAEVSPSTFFRYFPTKEDVILRDEWDPILVEAFLRQPPDMQPIPALRAAMRDVFDAIYPSLQKEIFDRTKLQMEVPALRARMMQQQMETFQVFAQALAERSGRRVDDPVVRTFAGAFMGVTLSAVTEWLEHGGKTNLLDHVDAALAILENGLRLD